ncbi:hypothetical protein [Kordiimonas marina]|uniref:hypothetical protein n=1 Tax=Kordiimonas marina TaxID=2872312 RepID=UPI001FF2852D|nr:hypothetical protein [Kordiimonas marina]MCJ9428106.1 hypothetical protein [Kordiimonas marina]
MVDINPNASGLQTQLQAQLQARAGKGPAKPVARVQSPFEKGSETGTGRQLIKSANPRTGGLSTDAEIEAATERATSFGAGQREAPIGRISTQAANGRNVPLGQIIDIRV